MKHPAITPLSKDAKVKMCLVTKSGYGKTVFAGTAPDCLFLTTDPEGTLSAQRLGSTAEEWKINSWDEPKGLKEAYLWLKNDGPKYYKWVVHDNSTEEQGLAMDKAMEIQMARPGNKQSEYIPDKPQYLYSQNAFIKVTKQFMKLDFHQIWTVHRKLNETDDGVQFYSANIQGQQGAVAEQFLGYMNIIGMGEVVVNKDKKEVRRLYFTHTGLYRGKDRFVALGRFKDDLTIPRMMEIIESRKDPAKPPAARRRRVATRTATA